MKVTLLLFLVVMVAMCSDAHAKGYFRRGWNYVRDFGRGSHDMWRAYRDMREANWKHSDKYFHARGNYRAAKRGTGGRHAAAILRRPDVNTDVTPFWNRFHSASDTAMRTLGAHGDLREMIQTESGRGHEDSEKDQEANRWGRNGGDPNKYRPKGLPKKY